MFCDLVINKIVSARVTLSDKNKIRSVTFPIGAIFHNYHNWSEIGRKANIVLFEWYKKLNLREHQSKNRKAKWENDRVLSCRPQIRSASISQLHTRVDAKTRFNLCKECSVHCFGYYVQFVILKSAFMVHYRAYVQKPTKFDVTILGSATPIYVMSVLNIISDKWSPS